MSACFELTQNSAGHSPSQPAVANTSWAGGCTRQSSDVPFNLNYYVVLSNQSYHYVKIQSLSVGSYRIVVKGDVKNY